MIHALILAAAMAGQSPCAGGSCGRMAYGYAPQMSCSYSYSPAYAAPACANGSCYRPAYAPYIPPQPAPTPAPAPAPAPAPSPQPLRPVPPSPYARSAAPALSLEAKVDALAKQVEALAKTCGICKCPNCDCSAGGGCTCGKVAASAPPTAFRFQ